MGRCVDELTKRLIAWLREYFHNRLLINSGEDDPGRESSEKACAILLTVKLRYLKGYKELWLLNEGGQKGCDRVLTRAQYDEICDRNPLGGPYNPIYVDIIDRVIRTA